MDCQWQSRARACPSPQARSSAKRWRSARPERDEGTLLWELSQYRHVRPLVFYSLREGGLGETSPAGFPLSPLPLIIPSPLPLWAGRSSRALPAFLLHQTASSAVASVATLCFAHSAGYDPMNGALHIRLGHTATKAVAFALRLVHEAVRQITRGEHPRTSYLFLSCSCLHTVKALHPSVVQVSVLGRSVDV